MPWVTVGPPSSARALPIATTGSPTATSPVANVAGVTPVGSESFSTAMSLEASTPTIDASCSLPLTVTCTVSAPSTTWALVRMCPSLSRTMPVPAPSA